MWSAFGLRSGYEANCSQGIDYEAGCDASLAGKTADTTDQISVIVFSFTFFFFA